MFKRIAGVTALVATLALGALVVGAAHAGDTATVSCGVKKYFPYNKCV